VNDFFSGFLCFAKDETDYFTYSNLIRNLFGIFVFAKILQNKCGSKCETRICEIIDSTRILIEYSIKFSEPKALSTSEFDFIRGQFHQHSTSSFPVSINVYLWIFTLVWGNLGNLLNHCENASS